MTILKQNTKAEIKEVTSWRKANTPYKMEKREIGSNALLILGFYKTLEAAIKAA